MRSLRIIAIVLFLLSCKEEDAKGLCLAYDESGEYIRCLGERSEEACAKLDADKHLGYDWKFSGTDICGPPLPDD